MRRDVYIMVGQCKCKFGIRCDEYIASSLYRINARAPKWAENVVEYLTNKTFPEKMSKVRQRYLQKQANDFVIISNQLYHRGKD